MEKLFRAENEYLSQQVLAGFFLLKFVVELAKIPATIRHIFDKVL